VPSGITTLTGDNEMMAIRKEVVTVMAVTDKPALELQDYK
jgi:hypothetical protein